MSHIPPQQTMDAEKVREVHRLFFVSSTIDSLIQYLLYHKRNLEMIKINADTIRDKLAKVKGLRVIPADGTLYVLVEIDSEKLNVKDDVDFSTRLLEEQAVFVLPDQYFQIPNFFRVVITAPQHLIVEACDRIQKFCTDLPDNKRKIIL
jgi:aspartate/methionine/tyrosine aminotransferase